MEIYFKCDLFLCIKSPSKKVLFSNTLLLANLKWPEEWSPNPDYPGQNTFMVNLSTPLYDLIMDDGL